MRSDTTSQDFFEDKYRTNPDPWHFASSPYEQSRYTATLGALCLRRYQRAFEPGCSIGILTGRLAAVCERVVAMDISPTAVFQARQHCGHLHNVEISCGALPAQLPPGTFDLVLLSEIGYYFTKEELFRVVSTLVGQIRESGTLLAVHWLGDSPDHQISGDVAHEVIGQAPGLSHQYAERHAGFRLDRWSPA